MGADLYLFTPGGDLYFRDSYNDWELLWKFGLSWWKDIIPLLDDQARLPVEQAVAVLGMLAKREPVFRRTIEPLPVKYQRNFEERYQALREMLEQAARLNLPIHCSL